MSEYEVLRQLQTSVTTPSYPHTVRLSSRRGCVDTRLQPTPYEAFLTFQKQPKKKEDSDVFGTVLFFVFDLSDTFSLAITGLGFGGFGEADGIRGFAW